MISTTRRTVATLLIFIICSLFHASPSNCAEIFILHECRSTIPAESVCRRDVTEYEWWGVYVESGTSILRRSQIAIKKVDDAETYVVADSQKEPLFLVRDMPGLTTGNIPAIAFTPGFVWPGTKIMATINRDKSSAYELTASGEGTNLDDIKHYQLLLKESKQKRVMRKHVIFNQDVVNGDFSPRVIWIGDIDRDGKPDLLISDAYNCGVVYSLLLSSVKNAKNLLEEAASIEFGCL